MSVVFLDIVGSTALAEQLDPEPLRLIMDRYFAACAAAIADHGGAVEKFIGDAVLAVFGAVVAHEDDAARATRAAVSALRRLRELSAEFDARYGVNLEARCGICTGDVVVIMPPSGDFRVVGDAVNTASRLQTAAGPGEILLDADTATMIRRAIGIEPIAPLTLKGKARAVAAWRVTDEAAAAGPGPAPVHPFIGRADELEELTHTFRRARRLRQACLVTVIGSPGIGKSRLAQEFIDSLPPGEVIVLSGSCSAYGKGITYKPLAEMLRSYPGGWAALSGLLSDGSSRATDAARALSTIAGEDSGEPASIAGVEDITWATSHLLEVLGRTRPVIMVWENLHWSEETLLDLIDHVATWLADVPVLLLCLARNELLELRPSWGGGKACAMSLELGPLTFEESAALVSGLALPGEVYPQESPDVYLRVAERCDGNPLFAELILDVLAETSVTTPIPPTIAALLGARLDQIPAQERRLLELAAVIGPEFAPAVLEQMAAADGISPADTAALTARLVQRRILRRSAAGAVAFAQSLLREITSDFTPKRRRQEWHDFLARWLASHDRDPMDVAYHAEASLTLRKQLWPGDPGLPELAATAAGTLIDEGMNALERHDFAAAVALLDRGRALLPPGDPRHTGLALHISDSGLALWDAELPLTALALAEAALPDDRRNTTTCAIERGIVALRLGLTPPAQVAADARVIEASLESDPEDHLSWCRLHQLQAYLHLVSERSAAADASLRLGLARARAMDDGYEEERLLCATCELARWAPRPVAAGLELCAALDRRFANNRALLVPVLLTGAHLTAIAGDLDGARRILASARDYTGDLHLDLAHAAVMELYGLLESLLGAHDKAERHLRQSLSVLRSARSAPDTQNTEVAIARELFEQGQVAAAEGALETVVLADEAVTLRARIAAGALQARIASARGRHDEAVTAARRAQALSTDIDDLCLTGETLFDLAVVLARAGMVAEAAIESGQALRKFDAKGATLLAGRVREWRAGLAWVPGTTSE